MTEEEQQRFHDLVEAHSIAQRCARRLEEATGERFFFQSRKTLSEMTLSERFALTKQFVDFMRNRSNEEPFEGDDILAEMRRLEA